MVSVGYQSPSLVRSDAPVLYICPVPVVPQVYSELCWAACIASIRNYKQGTNLTAEEVARAYYGDENFNRPLGGNAIANLLNTSGFSAHIEELRRAIQPFCEICNLIIQ
ncbi:MAG: hypothetical protein E7590_05875 [Ruminococcaceae bacterium]|nr:hypothetical protein [Oscillospiraceae bacterium]